MDPLQESLASVCFCLPGANYLPCCYCAWINSFHSFIIIYRLVQSPLPTSWNQIIISLLPNLSKSLIPIKFHFWMRAPGKHKLLSSHLFSSVNHCLFYYPPNFLFCFCSSSNLTLFWFVGYLSPVRLTISFHFRFILLEIFKLWLFLRYFKPFMIKINGLYLSGSKSHFPLALAFNKTVIATTQS